jgi:hypothetical protein
MQFPNSRNYKLPRRVLTDPLELVRGSSPGAVTERGWGGCATKHRATMWNHTAHLCNPPTSKPGKRQNRLSHGQLRPQTPKFWLLAF